MKKTEMNDYEFKIVSAGNRPGSLAVQRGLYFRLTDPKFRADMPAMAKSVQSEWRDAVVSLGNAGWEAATGVRGTYLGNCPPVAVFNKKRSRYCHVAKICPFCWGRDIILKSWDRAKRCGFENSEAQTTNPNYDLFTFFVEKSYASIEEAVKRSKVEHLNEIGAVESIGAMVIRSFLPRDKRITLQRRGLIFVKKGVKLPKLQNVDFRRLGPCSREGLEHLIGDFTHYPIELLRANPETTRRILDALRRTRLCTFSGAMYREENEPKKGVAADRQSQSQSFTFQVGSTIVRVDISEADA